MRRMRREFIWTCILISIARVLLSSRVVQAAYPPPPRDPLPMIIGIIISAFVLFAVGILYWIIKRTKRFQILEYI